MAALFFFYLSYFNTQGSRKKIIASLFIFLVLIICRSTTAIAIFIILQIYISMLGLLKGKFNLKKFIGSALIIAFLFFLFGQLHVVGLVNTFYAKITFDPSVVSASRRALTYSRIYETFITSDLFQLLFGRGTGYISANLEGSLSWVATLFIEKGLILTILFNLTLLMSVTFAGKSSPHKRKLGICLLFTTYCPLFVTTGYYFPYFAYAIAYNLTMTEVYQLQKN